MERMPKDGMLYRIQAKELHSVQNAKFYYAEGVKLNSPLMACPSLNILGPIYNK